MRTLSRTTVLLLATCTLTACPGAKDEEGPKDSGADAGETGTSGGGQASAGTGPETPPPERPESIPLLCSFDAGKWCTGCPQGSAGPLCCAGETCTPWDPAGVACDGDAGWCNNYSVSDLIDPKTSLKLATCHD